MFKWILLIIILVVVGYGGLSVYSNCKGPDTNQPDMPTSNKATHSFYIENTGGLILSSDYEQYGHEVGKRLFELHSYWEMRGNKFKFVDDDIMLDEAIFGEITVKRRAIK